MKEVDKTTIERPELLVDRTAEQDYTDYKIKFSQKGGCALPKSYSEQEREYIIRRLKEEAAACMGQYGIRKTTVDEIVRRVNIPKGTFYLFYKSKELLLFDAISEQHEVINENIQQAVRKLAASELTAEKLTDVIFDFFKLTAELPILKVINSEDIELLIRKLPEEVVASHFADDTDTIAEMFSLFPVKEGVDVEAFSAAFHAIYYATLHRQHIGEDQYEKALRILIYGVVTQMI